MNNFLKELLTRNFWVKFMACLNALGMVLWEEKDPHWVHLVGKCLCAIAIASGMTMAANRGPKQPGDDTGNLGQAKPPKGN